MSKTAFTGTARRELARRISGGIEIALFWDRRDNSTSIDVSHAETEETISFGVPRERALDAYYHPFAQLRWSTR